MATGSKGATTSQQRPTGPLDKELAFNPAEAHPVVYSDYVNVQVNISGFKMTFCTNWSTKPGKSEVHPHVTVGMSAEHAVMFHHLLGQMIDTYKDTHSKLRGVEKQKIAIPEEVLQQVEATKKSQQE